MSLLNRFPNGAKSVLRVLGHFNRRMTGPYFARNSAVGTHDTSKEWPSWFASGLPMLYTVRDSNRQFQAIQDDFVTTRCAGDNDI